MNTKTIGIKDLRNSLANIANEIEENNVCFEVYRRSTPSFKIVPISAKIENDWETVMDFTDLPDGGLDIDEALKIFQ